MATEDFFEKQSDDSRVKTEIVFTHFAAWLNIIGNATRRGGDDLAYMELFSGPGVFADGNRSTPMMVAQHAVNSRFANRMNLFLNEMDDGYAARLAANISQIVGVEKLAGRIHLSRAEVTRANHGELLQPMKGMPAVLFVDPWGYKGVSLDLFASFIDGAHMGRDAILFFNYRRITAALSNEQFAVHMAAMFGEQRAARLSSDIADLHGDAREKKVFAAIEEALHEAGARYSQRFEFSKRGDNLIFISKSVKGLDVAKTVMAKRSDMDDEGVASFAFDSRPKLEFQEVLFKPPSKLEELRVDLARRFAGRTVTFKQLFHEHHPTTQYVERNYRDVLLQMEHDGEIAASPSQRRAGTFGPNVRITFPRRKE
jgi:three-Cys-motif partner protein